MNMSTVEKNKRNFNNRQVKEAERARDLLHRIVFPNEQEYKEIVSNKVLEDFPASAAAIQNAEKIFGKDMCEIKAKTKRRKPNKVTITCYDPPKKQ